MSPELIAAISNLSPAVVAILCLGFVVYRQMLLFEKMEERQQARHEEALKMQHALRESIDENSLVTSKLADSFLDSDCNPRVSLKRT